MFTNNNYNNQIGHSIKNVFNNGAAEATAKTKATDLNISTLSANPALINQLVIGDAVAFQKNSLYQYSTTLNIPKVINSSEVVTSKSNILTLTAPFAHQFHLVNPSPWPIFTAFSLWLTILSIIAILHNYSGALTDLFLGFSCLIVGLFCWWRDVIRESTYELKHTPIVRQGIMYGIALFIVSEICLFFGFFWAFFNSSLVPSSVLGGIWPPVFIEAINPFGLPLVNTLTLIISGFTLTLAHRELKYVSSYDSYSSYVRILNISSWLAVTILLALFFLFCQAFEYHYATFTLSDGIYGTTFYSLTGLHGIHVVVGTIFLIVCLIRASNLHFFNWKQVGFKAAIWYWHFVDVVWILLFYTVYLWGNSVAEYSDVNSLISII